MSGVGGSIPITCPECGAKFPQPVAGLKAQHDFACPSCGTLFKPKESLDDALAKAREMARKALRGLSRPGKKR